MIDRTKENWFIHGRDCDKSKHHGDGYLHDEDDDRPYDVDGVMYCGRCHHWLSSADLRDAKGLSADNE